MASQTNTLSWGKCNIFIAKHGATGTLDAWKAFPTPVEDSTELTPTKGDKLEAKIEGGENEAVKYKRNTYALAFTIRLSAEREKIVEDKDGVIDGEYAVKVIPEDPAAKGVYIKRATLSLEDSFKSADGITLAYTADSLVPEDGSNQIEYGIYTDPTKGE